MITLQKNLRIPLAALLPLDVWEVNIKNSCEVTLVMSEFDLSLQTVWNASIDRGVRFWISFSDQNAADCSQEECDCITYQNDFLAFTVFWGYAPSLKIRTDALLVTSGRNAKTLMVQLQDVMNALLESQWDLTPDEALGWMQEVQDRINVCLAEHGGTNGH